MATIEIDGKAYQVENGKMIIEVTDELGIHIPRFCYHKKLSVAANCRMCLVQVDKSKKPLPACATPITDGMKIFTQSEETLKSQKAIMEFLLINHPLDCPICDQGGECELQDVSVGFGAGESDYKDTKRAVSDDDLGSLISTEMTRCIQCTRCVRFGEEVAGVRELGATGRGGQMQIGTYVQHAMTSEVSGNIIDLCPVGALTSKPYRFTARAWEMTQFRGVSPHDCLGSNLHVHVRRQAVMRVVPREEERLNETWLSDRDRFAYLGLSHSQRATQPKIKEAGQWRTVDWATALKHAATLMLACLERQGPEQFAGFASPSSTVEELYLFQRWMRALGVNQLDHRLQQTDFRDQAHLPMMPTSTLPYAELENQSNILLLGTHLHREVPLAGVRVRKASLTGGRVFAINPVDYEFPFDISGKLISSPREMVISLGRVLLSLVKTATCLPIEIQTWLNGVEPDMASKAIAEAIQQGNTAIVTGELFENHPEASRLRTLVHFICEHTAARTLHLTKGANTAGAWLAGMVPHRSALGKTLLKPGSDVGEAIEQQLKGYCLLNVDPRYDFAHAPKTIQAMSEAACVVALTAFEDEALFEYADVILPVGVFTESSGTYVNVDGTWQSFHGCSQLQGEARPAWKVLRVLANLMQCSGFDYDSSEAVCDELRAAYEESQPISYQPYLTKEVLPVQAGLVRVGGWPLYRSDALVRHSEALQNSASSDRAEVRLHPKLLKQLGLTDQVTVSQGEYAVTLPLKADSRVLENTVWVLNGMSETVDLGYAFEDIVCLPVSNQREA